MVIKCKNCGANLDTDDNATFCPYCGLKIDKPKDPHEFDKWKLNHEEEIRQRKDASSKNALKMMMIFVVILIIISIILRH